MNRTIQTLIVSAAALTSAVCIAAEPVKTDEARQKEIQQLVKANNQKIAALKRTMEGIPNWHNDKTPRNPEFINSNITEMVKLIKLPVGGADAVSEAEVQRLAAYAYAQPLNLRWYENAKKHYLEAIKLAVKPSEKANFAYEYADYMYRTAMEGDAAQWNKAKLDAFNTPGLTEAEKLSLLNRGLPGMDFEKDGWKLIADKPELHAWYYRLCFEAISKATGWQNKGGNPLSYAQSDEHKLELAEKAIDDTGIRERDKSLFYDKKLEALVGLERFDEAEQFLHSRAASTNSWQRAEASAKLGDFYVDRAVRYYGAPNAGLMDKALAAYAVALAHAPDNGGFVRKQVDAMMKAGKYEEAIPQIDYWVSLARDKKADKFMLAAYADCYYYMGDYAKACEYYDQFDDNNQALQHRYAESLYVIGRYDDAIAHIKRSYNSWSYKEANKYFIRKIEEKKAAAAATSR